MQFEPLTASSRTGRYRFADLTLDVGQRRLFRGRETLPLSRLSFEFLLGLVEAAPNLVTHDQLIRRVWGPGRIITAENLAKRALILRHSLGESVEEPHYFEVVRGQGYRLIPNPEREESGHDLRPSQRAQRVNHTPAWTTQARWTAALAVLVVAAAASTLAWNTRGGRESIVAIEPGVVRFEIVPGAEAPLVVTSYSRDVAISPDGSMIAYASSGNSIVIRELDRLTPRHLVGLGTDSRSPTFSPDGEFLAYLDGGALRRVPTRTDGPIVQLAHVGQFTDGDIKWSSDGTILVSNSRGVLRVDADGREPEVLIVPDPDRGERSFGAPSLLPDGRRILLSIEPARAGAGSRIAVVDPSSGQRIDLLSGATQPVYLPSGHLSFVVDGQLRVARFDPEKLVVDSEQLTFAPQISFNANGTANYSVSDTGSLVYAVGSVPPDRTLAWIDRDGTVVELLTTPAAYYTYPRLSPRGTHILLDKRWPDSDIWAWDIERETMTRVTNDPAENALPVWHPSGDYMAFGDGRSGYANVYWQSLNGGGPPERLTEGARRQLPFTISPDGRDLLYGEDQPDGKWNMWVLDLERRESHPLLNQGYSYWNTDLSPDGRWLVYQSDESGVLEVYVRPYPDVDLGRWQISKDGGSKPMWNRDGSEIYYIDPTGLLMAASVETFPDFVPGHVAPLFDTKRYLPYEVGARPYDLSIDGRRFLMTVPVSETEITDARLVVVVNWTREVARRLPHQT